MPEIEEDKARKYGELTCDIPMITAVKQMQALVEWIKESGEDIDMILWTGDSVAHDIHRVTEDRTFESIVQLSTLLKQYFPTTLVIPVLGNHDFHPLNYYNTNEPN